MYFKKEKFKSNASKSTQAILSKHLDVIDGMEVKEIGKGIYEIENYQVDGEEFYLYPVYEEWCTRDKQMSLL